MKKRIPHIAVCQIFVIFYEVRRISALGVVKITDLMMIKNLPQTVKT